MFPEYVEKYSEQQKAENMKSELTWSKNAEIAVDSISIW